MSLNESRYRVNHGKQEPVRWDKPLDPFEKAIRAAFEKGDASERAYREKVYRSAFAALERALKANPQTTVENAMRRKQMLSAQISQIESEFIPAVAPAVTPSSAGHRAPEVAIDPVNATGRPSRAPHDDEVEAPSYGEYAPRQRRRRPWLSLAITVVVLVLLGVGGWLYFAPGPIDPGFPTSPPMDTEDFSPEQEQTRVTPPPLSGSDLSDWILVFQPSDATTVTAPGDSRAELMQDESSPFMRITSGASGSPVLFDVRESVLQGLAGSRVVFNIVARAQEGAETQMSVECSLGELGDCGRKRYSVGAAEEEFLFEIDLPRTNPGSGGTIAINPDIEGSGRSVDVYAIRVTKVIQ